MPVVSQVSAAPSIRAACANEAANLIVGLHAGHNAAVALLRNSHLSWALQEGAGRSGSGRPLSALNQLFMSPQARFAPGGFLAWLEDDPGIWKETTF